MAGVAGKHINRLSARKVETAHKAGLYGDGGNLFLKVDDGGSKSWIIRWSSGGKVSKYGIGPVHTVSLAQARDKAAEVRRQIRDGIDPRQARREQLEAAAVAEAKSISFDAATARNRPSTPVSGTRRCRPTPARISASCR